MKRLNTPKRQFTYTVGEGTTVYTAADLEQHPHIRSVYNNWLESEKGYEREWRNYELRNTDWMLVADSTYGGEPLAGSQKLEEILVYRQALRDYNLTTDDRPLRPEWFVG